MYQMKNTRVPTFMNISRVYLLPCFNKCNRKPYESIDIQIDNVFTINKNVLNSCLRLFVSFAHFIFYSFLFFQRHEMLFTLLFLFVLELHLPFSKVYVVFVRVVKGNSHRVVNCELCRKENKIT